MNYFDLFGIPMQLSVDKTLLIRRFRELGGTDDAMHAVGHASSHDVQKSSNLVAAYKTLMNQDETIRYVLQLKGLMHEDEKYEPDPEFLMQLGTINESLAELTEGEQDKVEAIELTIKELLKSTYAEVEPVIENYKADSVSEKELLQVKEYYYRKKFLQRVLDKVAQMRNIAAL